MKYDMVAFDLDGVIVAEYSSWVWVHKHFGVDNSHSLKKFCDGIIDDHEFMRSDIAMWKDIDPDVNISQIRDILLKSTITKGSLETIRALKDMGVRTCIISGGIDLLAEEVGRQLGVERVLSNGLEADETGKLTGKGILRVELRDKASPLKTLMNEWGIAPEKCASVGNSWVDITMFDVTGYGIAFNPIDGETITAANVTVESDDLRDILPHLE